MRLSSRHYRKVLEIIETIYDSDDRETLLRAAFESLEKLIPICSGVHVPVDKSLKFQFNGHVAHNIPSEEIFLFCQYYAYIHPYGVSGQWVNHINESVRLTDIIPQSRLKETEYMRDFLSKAPIFYELDSILGAQGDPVGIFGLHRERYGRNFNESEKKIVDLILPHLSKALHNIDMKDAISSSLGIGLIEIGPANKPVYMNEDAKWILREHPSGTIPDPGLSKAPAFFKTQRGTYRVLSIPMWGKKKKVILLEPVPSVKNISSKLTEFHLTPRQTEITQMVICGYSNREIAERLYVTEQTVKDHIHDIFEKVKVRSRSELSAKVLGLNSMED